MKSLVILLLALSAAASPAQQKDSSSRCKSWCDNTNKPGQCTSQANNGLGACYTCGPYKSLASEKLCDGNCADTASDAKNCGSCGNECGSKKMCSAGKCVKSTTSSVLITSSAKPVSSVKTTSAASSSKPASSSASTSSRPASTSSRPASTFSSSKSASTASSSIVSSSSLSSVSASASSVSCPAATTAANTYAVATSGALGYRYVPPSSGTQISDSTDLDTTIAECENLCSTTPSCQAFWVVKYSSQDTYICTISPAPYEASYFSYDSTLSDPQSTVVYSVTNWTPPANILANGDFENGCLAPFKSSSSFGPTGPAVQIVPCGQYGDCISGSYYALLAGQQSTTPPNTNYGVVLSGSPITTPGTAYTVTAWVKGTSGELWINDNQGAIPTDVISATGSWQQVSVGFTGAYGQSINFFAKVNTASPTQFEWRIDDIQFTSS
ncbi:hypothetical protein BT63DRAFT_458919 [Microthyrium microscopicum]|uniref:Apple domain-containing protein n=1 Tax=Microthyrium microscopicum TaxID=703497 RepID=A0A6A6U1N0_9PEZI|nr:hypothetical protein BT63DRAFT_458919 [Microthyrium microscopicum]